MWRSRLCGGPDVGLDHRKPPSRIPVSVRVLARHDRAALRRGGVERSGAPAPEGGSLDRVGQADCEVIGVDYRVDLAKAAAALPGKAIQGNLDPTVLFGDINQVKEKTKRILDGQKDLNRLIFNLGHGILPKTPIEAVEAVVETVHSYRA